MKKVIFVGSSLKDLKEFPEDARSEAGHALYLAQRGERAINAIPMTGFGSSMVLEVVIPEDGDAYRAIYTVKFDTAVYVLHAFQKKSKAGAKTPAHDIHLIWSRLKDAQRRHIAIAKERKVEKKNELGSG
jgi:phage-related protein